MLKDEYEERTYHSLKNEAARCVGINVARKEGNGNYTVKVLTKLIAHIVKCHELIELQEDLLNGKAHD